MVMKRYDIQVPDEAIDNVLNLASEQEEKGSTQWSGMTYEQGVKAAILWIVGDSRDNPMED